MLASGKPVLGICYGLQFIAHHLGGKVRSADKREYGHAEVSVVDPATPLFAGLPAHLQVWMSHGDEALDLPPGFHLTAKTSNAVAGIANPRAKHLGSAVPPRGSPHAQRHRSAAQLPLQHLQSQARLDTGALHPIDRCRHSREAGDGHAICALSGGVDSSVAAVLVHRAIGDRLTCVFVDNGVLRKNEFFKVQENLREKLGLNLVAVDASGIPGKAGRRYRS